MSGMTVRAPRRSDVSAVNRICFQTGYSDDEVAELRPTPDLLGLVWADPYLAFAPQWCRVAVDGQGVAGYLLAVPSTRDFDRWAQAEWWPGLQVDHPVDAPRLSPADRAVARLLVTPPASPEPIVEPFPAHLHIDFLPRARGLGLAGRLIHDLVDRLAAARVPGVHLGVAPRNTNAIGFYEHLGFERLRTEPDTIWMGRRTGA